ncbi:MAG TPA: heme-copper oxidase subunit III [Acidimicrobiales bacterium]|nr:heme-copper oxidase subunit III [Acidimicrobiales bacterium]
MSQAISVDPHHQYVSEVSPNRPNLLNVGVMVWLGSELMFFSGLFAAYFTIRAQDTLNGVWPPRGIELDVLQSGIFTAILVASSFTMQRALWSDERRHNRTQAKRWIVISFVMGSLFLGNQGYEWFHVKFHISTNAFSSLFFLMTGLHGLHVFVGLVAMVGLLGRMAGPGGDPGERPVFQVVTYYWHFVDIVWVFLYASIFLLKG